MAATNSQIADPATVRNLYRYPDPHDATTACFVRENETCAGAWEQTEDLVLSFAVGRVAARFAGRAHCVDAGAGTGRLTRRFGAVSAAVTALELDPSRFDRETMSSDADKGGFELTLAAGSAADIAELPDAPFDVVVLSHVIQHAPRAAAATIVKAAAQALRRGGLLYLSLPVSGHRQDDYVLAHVANGYYLEHRVDGDEFDRLCLHSPEGCLPTRKFSLRTALRSLEHAAFRIDNVLAFHFEPTHPAWPKVPCVAEVIGVDSAGVVDIAILATRR
jgi:2-polyprenyl-3-methyl-5-hydroxy-6-metoxy-1,4-benzoquinol methylase